MRTLFLISVAVFAISNEAMADVDTNEALRAVAQSTGGFANNFLKTVASKQPGNLITSPLSAQIVLAMAAYGAGGTTAAQMRSCLLLPPDDELGQSGYKSLIETLNAVTDVELRLANKLFSGTIHPIKSTYKDLTASKFLSTSQEVDFSNGVAAAGIINAWCEEQTNHRIKNVVTPDSLSVDTALVLVNAVYFKGLWLEPFNPILTHDRPFHIDTQTTKNVPTMYIKSHFRYGNLPEVNARFLELPYKGEKLSMIIILPNEIDGIKTLPENLHRVNMTDSLARSYPQEVEVFLPKFKIESSLDLKEVLEKMGMTEIFQNGANLSGISDTPLKVSKVIQKAFIEVNEEGSEAAAVTELEAVPPSLNWTDEMKVDRPFLYLIVHRKLDSPLFSGQIMSPAKI